MSESLIFRIGFDKPEATYEPGEEVTGKVTLNVFNATEIRQVKLEAEGECKTEWSDAGLTEQGVDDRYRSYERYFSMSNCLVGGTENVMILPAGQHSYDFRFHLPRDIPSSFENEYGYIRYKVEAIVDRPRRSNRTVSMTFAVIAPYDLNAHPNLMVGIHDSIEQVFLKCCCFEAGTLDIDVRTRVKGYVSGEAIDMIIAYDNKSDSVNLIEMELKLFQIVIFTAEQCFEDTQKMKVQLGSRRLMGPFEKLGETKLQVIVPSISPTNLEHCSFIDMNYCLSLTIVISGMHFNVKRSYPVEIGDIPWQGGTSSALPSSPTIEEI